MRGWAPTPGLLRVRYGFFEWGLRPEQPYLKLEFVSQVVSPEIVLEGGNRAVPIYDFRCRDCGKVSEIFLRDAGQVARCPDCGSDNMERLISASYMIKSAPAPGTTCCGRTERCETPPCSSGDICRRR